MDGLSRASGAGIPLQICIGGITHDVIMNPLALRDYGVLENHLLAKKRAECLSALGIAWNSLPKELADRAYKDAMEQQKSIKTIDPKELSQWIDTHEGAGLALWIVLDRRYPGRFTRDQITGWFDDIKKQAMNEFIAFLEKRDQVHAEDQAGNSNGPAPATDGGRAKEVEQAAETVNRIATATIQPTAQ